MSRRDFQVLLVVVLILLLAAAYVVSPEQLSLDDMRQVYQETRP